RPGRTRPPGLRRPRGGGPGLRAVPTLRALRVGPLGRRRGPVDRDRSDRPRAALAAARALRTDARGPGRARPGGARGRPPPQRQPLTRHGVTRGRIGPSSSVRPGCVYGGTDPVPFTRANAAAAGRKGGLATVERYGRELDARDRPPRLPDDRRVDP